MRGPLGGGMFGGRSAGITVQITPALLWNTGAPVFAGVAPNQFWRADTDATVEVVTSDGQITIEVVADAVYNTLGIWVNGVFNQVVTYSVFNVKTSQTITLPAGANKRVQITSFCHVTSVTTNGTVLPKPATVASRLVVWGDSISAGYYSTGIQLGYVSNEIRHSGRFEGVTNFSTSGDAVFVHTPATIAADLVSRFADCVGEKILYIEMGTNDFGQQNIGFSNAADFATRYGQITDQVHANDPTIKIRCQSLFPRSFESANSFGSTWADFNNAISGLVATRLAFCTLMIGARAFTVGQTVDGLHPSDAGHVSAAAWWLLQDDLILHNPGTIAGAALIAAYSAAFSIPTPTGMIDISNNGHNLVAQGSPAPTIAAAAINGYDCAKLASANHNGYTVTGPATPAPATTPVYVYAIIRVDAFNTNQTLIAMGAANQMALLNANPNTLSLFNLSTFGPQNAAGQTTGQFKRIYYRFTGSVNDRVQCGSQLPVTGPNSGNTPGTGIAIGDSNSSFADETFAEAWFFNSNQDANLAAYDAYALKQWGAAPLA